jgi:hypothetical protein
MQKLVTVALYASHTLGGPKLAHGEVQDHLAEYLTGGWRVVSITAVGSPGGAAATAGWMAVLLERTDTATR